MPSWGARDDAEAARCDALTGRDKLVDALREITHGAHEAMLPVMKFEICELSGRYPRDHGVLACILHK